MTSSSTSPPTVAAYPLPRPACDHDPRFTYGLVFDIADVLANHGYPRPDHTDWADLMLARSASSTSRHQCRKATNDHH